MTTEDPPPFALDSRRLDDDRVRAGVAYVPCVLCGIAVDLAGLLDARRW
jgi:hypothetical protein